MTFSKPFAILLSPSLLTHYLEDAVMATFLVLLIRVKESPNIWRVDLLDLFPFPFISIDFMPFERGHMLIQNHLIQG